MDGLRINPGNIGERWKVQEVVKSCAERAVPIRIGVNGGSLEKELLEKYGHPTAEAMVESALGHIRILEDLGYREIKVSMKASDIRRTVEAYRLLSSRSTILCTSASPKRERPGAGPSRAPSGSERCSTTASATPCGSR